MPEYCYKCMRVLPTGASTCPGCGYAGTPGPKPHHLPPGTLLGGRYLVGLALGQGGFGITYIGLDLASGERIAVKEYYPTGYTSRAAGDSRTLEITALSAIDFIEKGKERFMQEAEVLKRLGGTDGVVGVRDCFQENETAYIVMEYLEGEDLQQYLGHHEMSAARTFRLFAPIMDALEHVHAKHVIHRDISPENIKVLHDGSLRLMDFGAARVVDYDSTLSLSVMLKPGYSPEEQYRSKGKQGPWTDIYALCATMYKCITGVTPDDSLQRLCSTNDTVTWPSQMGIDIAPLQEDTLKKGMAIRARNRFQSIGEMKAFLRGELVVPVPDGTWDGPAENGGPATYIPGGTSPEPTGTPEETAVTSEETNPGRRRGRGRKKRAGAIAAVTCAAVLGIGGAAFALLGGAEPTVAHARPEVTASGYEGTYDGKPHSATVSLGDSSNAELYYSEQPLSFENYQSALESGAASATPVERTDAGETAVYYLAVAAPVDSSGSRAETTAEDCTTGSVTVHIAKAKQKVTVEKRSYSKTTSSAAFELEAKAEGKLSYSSSKTSVAKVSKAGTVSVSGPGTAKITVSAAATKNYRSAKASVTVKVRQAAAPTYQSTETDGASGTDSGGYSSGNDGSESSSSVSGKSSGSGNASDSVEIDGWV